MNRYYFDSSGLVKLYVTEPGSQWINTILSYTTYGSLDTILMAKIGLVETAAAISKHERMKKIALAQRDLLYQKLLYDTRNRLTMIAESDIIILLAASLTQRHSLRGYDAVHLATALEINRGFIVNRLSPLTFVSADDKLCQSAIVEGLATENPNNHP